MKVAAVIAAYNESENIGPLCRRLLATLRAMPAVHFALIFVVEGDDGTEQVLRRLALDACEISIIRPSEAAGLGGAFRVGFRAVPADVDLVVTMDADLNHAPEDIPRLVAALLSEGVDIAIGSRLARGGSSLGVPQWKLLLSGTMNLAIQHLFHTGIRDQTSGYRVYRAEVIRNLRYSNNGYAFLPELLTLATARGYRATECPITFQYRQFGRSKMFLLPTTASYLRYFAGYWRHAFPALVGARRAAGKENGLPGAGRARALDPGPSPAPDPSRHGGRDSQSG
jgi:dolichol-phosphate mannosyltransferase